ncbi:MAG: dihydroneopterin aldolase [Candidatus Lindowbacteria bacterium]|nr:dihydroneopterin aldolase [Candidatus Lindowbacteria bacterium]
MKDCDKLTLKNMVFLCSLGCTEWERHVRTRVEVDVEISTYLKKACKSDDVSDTINYLNIYDVVSGVVNGKHHNLIESVAQEVAADVLTRCDCEQVVVRVRKPHPPLNGMCDCAEIEIVRQRVNRK